MDPHFTEPKDYSAMKWIFLGCIVFWAVVIVAIREAVT